MTAALLLLLVKITPLYGIAVGGFFAGRHLKLQRETLATLLLYFVAPVVFFFSVVDAEQSWHQILLVPVFLGLGSLLGLLVYASARNWYSASERGMLGFIAGSGNTGYFGIPLVAMLLGPEALVAAVMITIGLDLFQFTLGYYLMAKHDARPREAVRKIVSSPVIWAFVLGVLFVQTGWQLPPAITDIAQHFKGAYIVLGMLVVGLGLSGLSRKVLDIRFVTAAFAAKFVLFPLCVCALVAIDEQWLHGFTPVVHRTMLLLSLVPIASDTVAFATVLGVHPQKAAHTVMLSSLFAVLYIPILAMLFKL